jgi:hypothetical protein
VPKGKNYRRRPSNRYNSFSFYNKYRPQTGRTGNLGTAKYHFFCEKKYDKESVHFTVRDTVYRSCRNEATELRQT